MVVDSPRRNRAQLILVGCLALAFVIVSMGLLINSTVYTQSASPALSNAQIDSAQTFEYETRQGMRGLIHRLNHGERDRSESQLDADVRDAMNTYSALLAESYARNEPAVINVSYNEAESQHGTRVIQPGDGDWDPPASSSDYLNNPPGTPRHEIGWFVINVNVSRTDQQSATDPFTLAIEDAPGDTVSYELYRNESGIDGNLTIQSTLDNGSTYERDATCNPRNNRVLIDAVSGSVIGDGCTGTTPVFGVDELEIPHASISVEQPTRFHGRWEFVTNRSESEVDVGGSCNASPGPGAEEGCSTAAIWTANVTTLFDGGRIGYERARDVNIYG